MDAAMARADENAKIEGWCSALKGELKAAKAKHPEWPSDVVHAAAILQEEAGELIQAALDFYYSHGSKWVLVQEAEQCGAMALRFLENLDKYERKPDDES